MIPLLRRSTKTKNKKRPVIIFNCGQSNDLFQGFSEVSVVNVEKSNDELIKIGRGYVCILISDFVLFDYDSYFDDPFFYGMMLAFCDNQKKLYGVIYNKSIPQGSAWRAPVVNVKSIFDIIFDSGKFAEEWLKKNLMPKKLKVKNGGELYLKSIKKFMSECLNTDAELKAIYNVHGHARNVIDNLPRDYSGIKTI